VLLDLVLGLLLFLFFLLLLFLLLAEVLLQMLGALLAEPRGILDLLALGLRM
jgi:hypothetical protein